MAFSSACRGPMSNSMSYWGEPCAVPASSQEILISQNTAEPNFDANARGLMSLGSRAFQPFLPDGH